MTYTLGFAYGQGKPSGQYEGQLARFYKWVQTNMINPTTSYPLVGSTIPDRLAPHSHHGESTHLLIQGDMRIMKQSGNFDTYELSREPGGKLQDLVPPNMTYSATSRNGCTFVEGHRCLSPRTAERFLQRGTIKVVEKGGRARLLSEETLKKWLVQVKFDPRGKAMPDRQKGEMPILDITNTSPPMPRDVHLALSNWFEKEWRNAGKSTASRVFANTLLAISLWIFVAWVVPMLVSMIRN